MARKHVYTGKYSVGDDPRTFETPAAAISLAQTFACRSPKDVRFYVRALGEQGACAKVEKVAGIVYTQRLR